MIRFTSTHLRQALMMTGSCHRPLILEKNVGIFIRVPDGDTPGQWLKAYAEGCDPKHDAEWANNADALIPETEYSFLTFICQATWNAVVHDHYDLFMIPSATTVATETKPPEKVFVRVAEFRHGIDRLFDQAGQHFSACVGNREKAAWRRAALYVLDDVIRLDCKRAKPDDRERFARGIARMKDRISTVTVDGEVRNPYLSR